MKRSITRRDILKGSAAAVTASVFASPVRAAPPPASPIDDALIAAARKEGKLAFYTAMDLDFAQRLGKAFEAKYGQLSSYGPLAYEAANIILEAVKKTGKAERAAVRDAVRTTKNYRGVLGVPISFDAKGDVAGGVIFVYQVKGRAFEQVKTIVVR